MYVNMFLVKNSHDCKLSDQSNAKLYLKQSQSIFCVVSRKTSFYLMPGVFGCICFVHNFGHMPDKLLAKSTRSVFLGSS